jgi:hypothetical protein
MGYAGTEEKVTLFGDNGPVPNLDNMRAGRSRIPRVDGWVPCHLAKRATRESRCPKPPRLANVPKIIVRFLNPDWT